MCAVLVIVHASIAYFEHVGIVPVARTRKLFKTILIESNFRHDSVLICDVSRGTPQIAANRLAPRPDFVPPIFTKAENDRPPSLFEGVAHFLVRIFHFLEATA